MSLPSNTTGVLHPTTKAILSLVVILPPTTVALTDRALSSLLMGYPEDREALAVRTLHLLKIQLYAGVGKFTAGNCTPSMWVVIPSPDTATLRLK